MSCSHIPQLPAFVGTYLLDVKETYFLVEVATQVGFWFALPIFRVAINVDEVLKSNVMMFI